MKRALAVALLTLATSAFAQNQCSPFDQEPNGGSALDNVACCEGAFNDDGCEPGICKNGSEPDKSRNVGRPVDTLSGFAWFERADVRLPQPWGPPVAFVRTYSTGWAQTHGGQDDVGPLGPGWSHNFNDHLVLSGAAPASLVVLRRGDTGTEAHRFDGTKYVARLPNRQLRWDAATSTYALEQPDGGWLVFDVGGKLRTLRAADGGESQLRYVGEDATCAVGPTPSRRSAVPCRLPLRARTVVRL